MRSSSNREITAQPSDKPDATYDLTIQALSSHPELLPRPMLPTKKRKKAHDHFCECDVCEANEDPKELDF